MNVPTISEVDEWPQFQSYQSQDLNLKFAIPQGTLAYFSVYIYLGFFKPNPQLLNTSTYESWDHILFWHRG
jgi:hypothetical protein